MEFPPSMSPMESQRKALRGSFYVCATLVSLTGDPGIWALLVPRNWVRDYVFNSYYEDKR